MLYHAGSKISQKLAQAFNDAAVGVTGFDDKGTKALKSGDRGYLSVASAEAPAVLTEPFFGDYEPHAKKIGELGHRGVAEFYLDGIRKAHKILNGA